MFWTVLNCWTVLFCFWTPIKTLRRPPQPDLPAWVEGRSRPTLKVSHGRTGMSSQRWKTSEDLTQRDPNSQVAGHHIAKRTSYRHVQLQCLMICFLWPNDNQVEDHLVRDVVTMTMEQACRTPCNAMMREAGHWPELDSWLSISTRCCPVTVSQAGPTSPNLGPNDLSLQAPGDWILER